MHLPLTDSYRRKIDYIRISITDRCNLRCNYCMPHGFRPALEHEDILRYEEILRMVNCSVRMGVTKVRITGGEPLVRKDVVYLCESIARIPGISSLSLTTNGVLLSSFAEPLFSAGIKRINISLDTLRPERYAAITGCDRFRDVWRGIEKAVETGFSPVKLNVVVVRGMNDDEIEDLARLTFSQAFHVRFIELMPFKANCEQEEGFVSSDEIMTRLSGVAPLEPAEASNSNGPARHYRFHGARGMIGLISPISHHFCPACNRLRLTADGKLRACLFATEETDLRRLIRGSASDDEIAGAIMSATLNKPEKHALDESIFRKCINRPMFSIGG